MALKRKKLKENLTTEEMLLAINRNFIKNARDSGDMIPKFVIETVCEPYDNGKFLVCDSRENLSEVVRPVDLLPCYSGESIYEALKSCYLKHG